jgi:hypothetical protein
VVAPENVRWLGESVRFLVGLGARQIILNPCFEEAWSDDDLAALGDGLRDAAEVYADCMRGAPGGDADLRQQAPRGGQGRPRELRHVRLGRARDRRGALGQPLPLRAHGGRRPRRQAGHRAPRRRASTGAGCRHSSAARPTRRATTCAEKWRCGASCACANLAETGTTHLPGGTQCWYEQATARIADGAGHRLLHRRGARSAHRPSSSWTYGRRCRASIRLRPLHRVHPPGAARGAPSLRPVPIRWGTSPR